MAVTGLNITDLLIYAKNFDRRCKIQPSILVSNVQEVTGIVCTIFGSWDATWSILAKISVRSYNLEISFIAAFRHHFTNGFSRLQCSTDNQHSVCQGDKN